MRTGRWGVWFPPAGLAVVVLVALWLPAPGHAQQRSAGPVTTGWAEAGLGYGWAQLTCEICRSERTAGVEMRLGIGRMVRPGLGLGTEVSAWISDGDPARQMVGSVHVVGRVRPGDGPIHVQAGFGTGHYRAFEPGDGPDVGMLAPSGRIGMGADVPIGARYLVQPWIGATFAAFGTLRTGDQEVWNRVGFNLVRAGVSLSRRATR